MNKRILLIFSFTLILVMSLMLLTSCGDDTCDHVDDNDDMYCDECGMPCVDDESILGVLQCSHTDDNGDSLCDKCGIKYVVDINPGQTVVCQHRDTDDNSLCDKCGVSYTDGKDKADTQVCQHRDADDNSLCDSCKASYTDGKDIPDAPLCQHRDADDNSLCDKCEESYTDGKDIPDVPPCQHRDLDDNAVCDKCEEEYSDGNDVIEIPEDNPYDLAFYLKGDGTYMVIIDRAKYYSKFEVPQTYLGKPVTEIGAFSYISGGAQLEEIIIPECITAIGEYAFAGCNNLDSLVIPDSVQFVSGSAFYYCDALTIYCEAQSAPAEWDPYWNSYNRPVVWDCNNNDVAEDGYIYTVINGIRYALKDSEAKVIRQKDNIIVANIPSAITHKDIEYSVKSIEENAFSNLYNLTSVTVSDSVTQIGRSAFSYCSNLISVTVSDSVAFIDYDAFRGSGALTIYCEAASAPSEWDSDWNAQNYPVVWNCKNNEVADDGCIYVVIGGIRYALKEGEATVTVQPSNVVLANILSAVNYNEQNYSVTSIANSAFSYSALAYVFIPQSVTVIGDSAFEGCNIQTVTIPSSVTIIGGMAFAWCYNLTDVNISEGVTTIGDNAFSGCAFDSIIIPESVTYIGSGAFYSPVIYCRAAEKPDNWNENWTSEESVIIWDYCELEDENGDYLCDVCGKKIEHDCIDENEDLICDLCNDAMPHDCIDENEDLFCDICDEEIGHDCIDENWDGVCDVCYEEISGSMCGACIDINGDNVCDVCESEVNCDCVDADGDTSCDYCMAYVAPPEPTIDYPWEETTLIMQLTENTNGQELFSVSRRYLAGEDDTASDDISNSVRNRNAAAEYVTKTNITYYYYPDTSEYGWGTNIERIQLTNMRGVDTPDIYSNFVYDMVGASLKECFANLLADNISATRGTNYFEFVKDDYDNLRNDEGYMYEYMQSLTLAPNSKMYVLASDYFIDMVRSLYCIPVSNRIMEDRGASVVAQNPQGMIVYEGGDRNGDGEFSIDDFYEQVKAGEWTYELLARFSAAVYAPCAGNDGTCIIGDETVGFAMSNSAISAAGLLYTTSVEIIKKEVNGDGSIRYYYPADNQELYEFCDATTDLFRNSAGVCYVDSGYSQYGATALQAIRTRFTQNKVLFGDIILVGSLEFSEYQEMNETGGGFGVVPVPLYRSGSDDKYLSQIHNTAICGAISAVTQKFSQCTAFLNYQSTHSEDILNNYYKYKLQYDVSGGSTGTVEMLQYIRDNVRSSFDKATEDAIGIFSGTGNPNRWHNVLRSYKFQVDIRSEYSSTYNRNAEYLEALAMAYPDFND